MKKRVLRDIDIKKALIECQNDINRTIKYLLEQIDLSEETIERRIELHIKHHK
jgi:hypothetical protein